jgi:hypothetical protein
MLGGALTVDDIDADRGDIAGWASTMAAGTDARHLHAFCLGRRSSRVRNSIDRAAARERRVATD